MMVELFLLILRTHRLRTNCTLLVAIGRNAEIVGLIWMRPVAFDARKFPQRPTCATSVSGPRSGPSKGTCHPYRCRALEGGQSRRRARSEIPPWRHAVLRSPKDVCHSQPAPDPKVWSRHGENPAIAPVEMGRPRGLKGATFPALHLAAADTMPLDLWAGGDGADRYAKHRDIAAVLAPATTAAPVERLAGAEVTARRSGQAQRTSGRRLFRQEAWPGWIAFGRPVEAALLASRIPNGDFSARADRQAVSNIAFVFTFDRSPECDTPASSQRPAWNCCVSA